MVEFAIILPLLVLLLCGTLDFGLMFGGYTSMESGVASVTRELGLNQYQYSGSASCTGGPGTGAAQTATADAVCNVVESLGSLTGLNTGTLAVGICFVTPGSTPSCSGASAAAASDSNDVEVCAHAGLESTTGLTSIFVSGTTVTTSSRQLVEQPQPSGPTAFQSYNSSDSSSTPVMYNGSAVTGLTCT
jgi:Flp pilus assembly protein TadG